MEPTAVCSKTFPIVPAELFSDCKRKEVGVLFPILQVCNGSTNYPWSTLIPSSLTRCDVDRVLATMKSAWHAVVNHWHHQTLALPLTPHPCPSSLSARMPTAEGWT